MIKDTYTTIKNEQEKSCSVEINSFPTMTCISDHEGKVYFWNNLFKENFSKFLQKEDKSTLLHIFHSARKLKNLLTKLARNKRGQLEVYTNGQTNDERQYIASSYYVDDLLNGKPGIIWSILDITEKYKAVEEKERVLKELDSVNNKLVLERDYLRDEFSLIKNIGDIVGSSPALIQMVERIKSVAETDASVLIEGESGSGKELVARLIHEKSNRKEAPMVTVNCASIPSELFESEFFGHVKGAFSGAVNNRIGRFELAANGTLFLDEVGEIPIELQSKLLRSIQQKSFERVGENVTREVNVRIIAATNRNLEHEVEKGLFREDLYYRLSVFPISVPPLRKRKDDVIPLAEYFLKIAQAEFSKQLIDFSEEQLKMLQEYNWPGNIRELKNVIERAVILSDEKIRLDLALPKQALREIGSGTKDHISLNARDIISDKTMREIERNNIINALEMTGWRVSGTKGAAVLLEMNSSTLSSRINALQINKPNKNSLYKRIGGIYKIRLIVDDLIAKVRSDSHLGRFWKNRGIDSIRMEKKYLVDYICESIGGPYNYTGRDMLTVHHGMDIKDSDWEQMSQYLLSILYNHQISEITAKEFIAKIEEIKSQIVC